MWPGCLTAVPVAHKFFTHKTQQEVVGLVRKLLRKPRMGVLCIHVNQHFSSLSFKANNEPGLVKWEGGEKEMSKRFERKGFEYWRWGTEHISTCLCRDGRSTKGVLQHLWFAVDKPLELSGEQSALRAGRTPQEHA